MRMMRGVTLIAVFVTTVLFVLSVFAQSITPKSAVVRIIPGDANKIPGTGFIVKLDERAAYILTAAHVVEGGVAPKVEFFTQRNSLVPARVAQGAEWGDGKGLAVLIVDSPLLTGLTTLPIDASAKLEGGEAISVIGHPASGGNWSISKGDFSSRAGRVLYFDARIDKGNSGGPLLREGKVVGIVTNKGPQFGEAVSTLAIVDFLNGSNIDVWTTVAPTLPPVTPKSQDIPIAERPAGQVFKDCDDCPEMVVVPAGSFLMGSPESERGRQQDEGPQHKVSIPRPLAIGRTEVTRAQFARFVADTGHKAEGGCYAWDANKKEFASRADANWNNPGFAQTGDHPVVCVSWDDTKAYAQWLAKKTGKNYRLLSEAEWEYAARAGVATARYWGEVFDPEGCKAANIGDATAKKVFGKNFTYAQCDDGQAYTAPVGSYAANRFGLYDTIGNAWEWTAECWSDTYTGAPENGNARGEGECDKRVLRGGSWFGNPVTARAAKRIGADADSRNFHIGLRVASTD